MLPKFELAPMRTYLRMLANTLRPSITPSSSTIRLFSKRMMSAASLAMSTALSTEMPTSAVRRAGRVVDAVSEEADDVPLALQRADHPLLVGRREPGEERGSFNGFGKFGVGHRFHLPAQQHPIGRQAHLRCRFCG